MGKKGLASFFDALKFLKHTNPLKTLYFFMILSINKLLHLYLQSPESIFLQIYFYEIPGLISPVSKLGIS